VRPQVYPETAAAVLPGAPDGSGATVPDVAVPVVTTGSTGRVDSETAKEGEVRPAPDVFSQPQTLTAAQAEATPSQPRKPKKSLIKAVKENDLALVDELLRGGAALEDLGMWDNTPLIAACTYGHAEAALRLIAQKANVRAANEHGATPMHYAAVEGLQDVVEALLAAVRSGGDEIATAKLVNCGLAKVYNRHLDTYARRTPLASAAESGFADVVGVLQAAGAELEALDEEGRSPLWLAARHSRVAVVRTLLQQGADANVKDSKGVSVLEAATVACSEELVLALLSGSITDVNDTAGSPLRDAVRAGKRSVAEALLTHGASVELRPGVVGQLPLHAACEKGDEYLVSLLVRSRADPSLSDAAGQTAFDLLRRRGLPDVQIVALLSPPSGGGGSDGSTGATTESQAD